MRYFCFAMSFGAITLSNSIAQASEQFTIPHTLQQVSQPTPIILTPRSKEPQPPYLLLSPPPEHFSETAQEAISDFDPLSIRDFQLNLEDPTAEALGAPISVTIPSTYANCPLQVQKASLAGRIIPHSCQFSTPTPIPSSSSN